MGPPPFTGKEGKEMPRVIDVPDPVKVLAMDMEKRAIIKVDYSFFDFIGEAIENYQPLGRGRKAAKQGKRIETLVDEGEQAKAKTLKMQDEDFETVVAAVDAMAWKPSYNREFPPFYEALEKAQEIKE